MALFCPDKVSEQDAVLNDARLPSPPQTPHLPACWVQQATEDAQYSAEKGVAVNSQTMQKHSNAERLNITKVSLDDNLSAQTWRYCPFQKCKAKTLCQD